MNFETWLDELKGDDTRAAAAKKAGYSQSTITRQLSRGHIRPETVIALCRAYERSPVTGLIETGYINSWEADDVGIPFALENATNQQILDEIMRRSDPESRHLFNRNDPDVTPYTNEPHLAPIPNQEEPQEEEITELTAVPFHDDEYDYLDYAADSSPDEDALRYEYGEDPID